MPAHKWNTAMSEQWPRRLIYVLAYHLICFFVSLALREIERIERELVFLIHVKGD